MRIRPIGCITILAGIILVLIVISFINYGGGTSNSTASTAPTLSAADVRNTRELQSLLTARFDSASIERVIVSERTVIVAAFMHEPTDNSQQTAASMLNVSRGLLGGLDAMRVVLGDNTGIISQYDWVSVTGQWTVDEG